MKKLGLLFKEVSEKQIKNNLKSSESVFIMNYSKVSAPDFNGLRQALREIGTVIFMVKNSVARRALKDSGLDSLVTGIEGSCGLVFIKEEALAASRILCDFSRGRELFKLAGGFLKDRMLGQEDIQMLARLPSREVLRAKLVITLNSPISGLAAVLSQALRKFVCCLDQIKQKREKGG